MNRDSTTPSPAFGKGQTLADCVAVALPERGYTDEVRGWLALGHPCDDSAELSPVDFWEVCKGLRAWERNVAYQLAVDHYKQGMIVATAFGAGQITSLPEHGLIEVELLQIDDSSPAAKLSLGAASPWWARSAFDNPKGMRRYCPSWQPSTYTPRLPDAGKAYTPYVEFYLKVRHLPPNSVFFHPSRGLGCYDIFSGKLELHTAGEYLLSPDDCVWTLDPDHFREDARTCLRDYARIESQYDGE